MNKIKTWIMLSKSWKHLCMNLIIEKFHKKILKQAKNYNNLKAVINKMKDISNKII